MEQSNKGLCRDMLETVDIIKNFNAFSQDMVSLSKTVRKSNKLFLTGEGSSRIFPAKQAISIARQRGYSVVLHTEGACQAQLYQLESWNVIGVSNSGRTAEVIQLFQKLVQTTSRRSKVASASLTAFSDTKLQSLADQGFVLNCGKENAVAATKSVVEQALFLQLLIELVEESDDDGVDAIANLSLGKRLPALATSFDKALRSKIPDDIIEKLTNCPRFYFAGFNDGVAEELTLKTNEITRKPSNYLEGTYAVHGVEEAMNAEDALIWIDPPESQEEKFYETLVKNVGIYVVAISSRETRFPTLKYENVDDLNGYVALAMGWNLLVRVGTSLGIDIDKPQRARKVGNEFKQ
mmetsp:Transcript_15149/g.26035  ORF Transcript_15149/g.26035 Transcript_15149/m.26035 type:complete len:351 (+) Transcript_15149:566-1618(+)